MESAGASKGPHGTRLCSGCAQFKLRAEFSKKQWKKAVRKCMSCALLREEAGGTNGEANHATKEVHGRQQPQRPEEGQEDGDEKGDALGAAGVVDTHTEEATALTLSELEGLERIMRDEDGSKERRLHAIHEVAKRKLVWSCEQLSSLCSSIESDNERMQAIHAS